MREETKDLSEAEEEQHVCELLERGFRQQVFHDILKKTPNDTWFVALHFKEYAHEIAVHPDVSFEDSVEILEKVPLTKEQINFVFEEMKSDEFVKRDLSDKQIAKLTTVVEDKLKVALA
ncbi:MAG: hypothetical protein Q7S53_01905 [bacterium]|nr:hypothetical protein [bacterium]